MLKKRLIPSLLFNGYSLVKSIQFSNLRILGNPIQAVKVYNAREVDELVFLDIGATVNNRGPLFDVIHDVAEECFMPLTIGGGIDTLAQIRQILQIGSDKVALNSNAFKNPSLIAEAANKFGKQAIVISVDVKRLSSGKYEIRINGGKKSTGMDAVAWCKEIERLGAGEIFLTSIDRDGKMKGYDIELLYSISKTTAIPVIASGGAGKPKDFIRAIKEGNIDAVSAASIFHYTHYTPQMIKQHMASEGIIVRI